MYFPIPSRHCPVVVTNPDWQHSPQWRGWGVRSSQYPWYGVIRHCGGGDAEIRMCWAYLSCLLSCDQFPRNQTSPGRSLLTAESVTMSSYASFSNTCMSSFHRWVGANTLSPAGLVTRQVNFRGLNHAPQFLSNKGGDNNPSYFWPWVDVTPHLNTFSLIDRILVFYAELFNNLEKVCLVICLFESPN